MPVNAVIYARYSSHNQTDQSIEGQLRENYDFAKREGYTIIGEYIDRALSGRSDNRADFQRMIRDAAKKQYQAIIVWKLDRFARNRYDSAIYKARLNKYGVRVISATENITDNPEGIILEGMLESMAEYYSANLSKNVKRGQSVTISKGKYCGGQIPYGYKSENGKLVADELKAPIIRYLFEQYAAGVPKREIIDALNARGAKNSKGNSLRISSFQLALKNRTYIGQFTYNGEVVPGAAQPLVDEITFQKVQDRLKAVAHAPAATKAPVEYLLQGKAFCGCCGSTMIGESGRGKGGKVYRYYTCSTRKKNHTCKKKNEKKDFAEWYVVEQTQQYVLTPEHMQKIAKAVVGEYEKEFNNDAVIELERGIARMETKINNLMDSLSDAPKSLHKRIYTQLETLEIQKADTEADLAKLRIAQKIRFTEEEVRAWLRQFCNGDPLDEEFRKRIINVFINSVYFYDNRTVIFYNIYGGKQISYLDLQSAPDISPPPSSPCSDLNTNALPVVVADFAKFAATFFVAQKAVAAHPLRRSSSRIKAGFDADYGDEMKRGAEKRLRTSQSSRRRFFLGEIPLSHYLVRLPLMVDEKRDLQYH